MKELRCLVFNDQEVVNAVFDRRRKRGDDVPKGVVMGVTFHDVPIRPRGLEAMIHVTDDFGDDRVLTVDEIEMAAALVHHCMSKKIPLPVDSDKSLFLIKGSATLMITMNFKRPPRMIPVAPVGDRDGVDETEQRAFVPDPRRRPPSRL